MKTRITLLTTTIILGCFTTSASADIILSGTELQGLSYTATGPSLGNPAKAPSSTYVSSGGGYADLFSPDGNGTPDIAEVTVANGYDGVSLGTLDSLVTAGAAGNVSFNLKSQPQGGDAPFWVITLKDPNSSSTVTITAEPDKAPGSVIGANNFDSSEGSNYAAQIIIPGTTNLYAIWMPTVENDMDDGTALGTWSVSSVGVLMNYSDTAPQEVEISSFTLPGTPDPVPDGASTLSLLGISLIGLGALSRKFNLC